MLVGVVLALTGFSSTGGSGSGSGKSSSKSSSGGGGCSSSKSKPKKKSYGSGGGSGGGSSATPAPSRSALPAHLELIACAGPGRPKATIRITSDASVTHDIRTSLTFHWEGYGTEAQIIDVMALKPGEGRTLEVPMRRAEKADVIERCALGAVEVVESSSPTPTTTTGSADLPDGKKTSRPKPRSTRKTR